MGYTSPQAEGMKGARSALKVGLGVLIFLQAGLLLLAWGIARELRMIAYVLNGGCL